MQRREFAMWLSAVTLGSTLDAFAQRSSAPVVGYVGVGEPNPAFDEVFFRSLKDSGYARDTDVIIESRFAQSYEGLTSVITELVKRKVSVIVALGTPTVLAAKSITSTIPIVFSGGGDPVRLGIVASLNHPGGNVTGVANMGSSLEGKRIQVIHDLLPNARKIGYLTNPKFPAADSLVKEVQAAAAGSAMTVHVANASDVAEIESAFGAMAKSRVQAILVSPDSYFINKRKQIVDVATRHGIPTLYTRRDFVLLGGLISYGADPLDNARQLGYYTARILKGASPAELPVNQSLKVELVLNRKTADKLRLNISRDFIERVDAVVE